MSKRVAGYPTLAAYCKLIRERLDALPDRDWRDTIARQAYDDALAKLIVELQEAGAVIGGPSDGTAIRLAGIRSTSTSGVLGALTNWMAAAQKRIASQRTCQCVTMEQNETCPVGYPSLLCDDCGGTGFAVQHTEGGDA